MSDTTENEKNDEIGDDDPEDEELHVLVGPDGRTVGGAAERARVAELGQLFQACRQSYFETVQRFAWEPAADSYAARVASELPSPDPRVALQRHETGHRLISRVVQTYMLTAAGHMGALGALHESGEVFFSPGMLVRGVLECSARAMWVLGNGGDEPSQLLARAYLEEFLSAEEAKKVAGRLGGKESPTYISHKEEWRELRTEILVVFSGASKPDLAEEGGRTLAGERLPSPAAGASWMYELLESQAGSTVGTDAALGIYDFLSNATHPTLYPTRQLEHWVPMPGRRDMLMTQLRIDISFLERQAGAAVALFYNALSYVTSYHGWDRSIHDELTKQIDIVLPGLLSDPAPPASD